MKLPKDLSKKEVVEHLHKILNINVADADYPLPPSCAKKIFEDIFGKDCDRIIATNPDSHVLWQASNERK